MNIYDYLTHTNWDAVSTGTRSAISDGFSKLKHIIRSINAINSSSTDLSKFSSLKYLMNGSPHAGSH